MKPRSVSFLVTVTLPAALIAGLTAWFLSQTAAHAQTGEGGKQGTVEMIKVHGKSLEGNLEGDSPDRDVYVYLPPSYATDKNRRYPVVYFLHGYGAHAEMYWKIMTVPATADKEMGAGTTQEMILVHPDAYTIYNGSMYSNSPTTGNWEAYITHDLVEYIDGHYRTIADRASRGLAGHSMGGYGTLRIGMKYPEVYSSIYAMSSCCLMNNPLAPRPPASAQQATGNGRAAARGGRGNAFANVLSAEGAAWSPNPQNPPKFFDLPTQNDVVRPEIAAKWVANSPLAMVDQYVPNLKKYRAMMMDVGLQDGLSASNKEMDAELTRLGVTHTFETYEGDHMNHVKDRFAGNVLPFFSENLRSTATSASRR
jgi:enterochelin esterase-like enzyme